MCISSTNVQLMCIPRFIPTLNVTIWSIFQNKHDFSWISKFAITAQFLLIDNIETIGSKLNFVSQLLLISRLLKCSLWRSIAWLSVRLWLAITWLLDNHWRILARISIAAAIPIFATIAAHVEASRT